MSIYLSKLSFLNFLNFLNFLSTPLNLGPGPKVLHLFGSRTKGHGTPLILHQCSYVPSARHLRRCTFLARDSAAASLTMIQLSPEKTRCCPVCRSSQPATTVRDISIFRISQTHCSDSEAPCPPHLGNGIRDQVRILRCDQSTRL